MSGQNRDEEVIIYTYEQKERTDIEKYGFFGLFEDSEGNYIGLHSM